MKVNKKGQFVKEDSLDALRFSWLAKERESLRNLALKINNIPIVFSKLDGSLDLDRVHLALMDYQK